MATNKAIASLALAAGIATSLISNGCSREISDKQNQPSANGAPDDAVVDQASSGKILSIDGGRCSGCGRCVRIAPEYFAWDQNTGKARVITKDANTSSDQILAAVSVCRDRAINIE